MKKLANKISWEWVIGQLTAYTDDFRTAITALNTDSLDHEMARIGVIFDLLAAMGMKVNPKKSAALLRVRSSFVRKWLQRNIIKSTVRL